MPWMVKAKMELNPIFISLKVALFATAFAVLSGIAVGHLFARFRFAGAELLDAGLTLPMVLPPTVMGYYLLMLIGKKGLIGEPLLAATGFSFLFSWQGAVLAASVASFPLVFRTARTAFEGVDPELEDAARTLGQSELSVFLKVSLPLAWRGIKAGALLAFARSLGEFGATMMVAGNIPGRTRTLPLAIYSAVESGDDSAALVFVIFTSAICFAILMMARRLPGIAKG